MGSDKLNALLANEGMTEDEFMEEYAMESIVPGICMNPGCDFVGEYEPDQDRGYCEICGTQSVMSGLRLLGIM